MTQRGVAGILVALVTIVIGAAIFISWYMLREPPVPRPSWDGAVWAPNNWDELELLDVDDDGSLLLSFFDGAKQVADLKGVSQSAGQLPGVALVTPDGVSHVLRDTSSLDKHAVGSATGSVHHGAIAVAWQVVDNAVDTAGKVKYGSPGRTASVATGTLAGLSDIPTPTVDGAPVVVEWGGLHVADGALVAFVIDAGENWSGTQRIGLIDTATGAIDVIREGAFLAPLRDLCDPTGNTFGAGVLENHALADFQFTVVGGKAANASTVAAPPVAGNMLPVNACGADSAGLEVGTHTLYWTDGKGKTSMLPMDGLAGDVFLAPKWLAVHAIEPGGKLNEVVLVDRSTRMSTKVSDSCARVVPAGDWLAFGYPDGDRCVPVAVRVSTLLTP